MPIIRSLYGPVVVCRRIVLLCNDDLTTNLIFAPLLLDKQVTVVGIFFASAPFEGESSTIKAAFKLLRRMDWRYWLYLVFTNCCYLVFKNRWRRTLVGEQGAVPLRSLRALAKDKQIPVKVVSDFSSTYFESQLREMKVDVLAIRIGSILTKRVLDIPKECTICVHSSLLPSFKGIAGEFHALRTKQAPIGSTIFRVSPLLDAGPPLAYVQIERDEHQSVFSHMIRNNTAAGRLMLDLLNMHSVLEPATKLKLPESYFSWPTRAHMTGFRKQGLRLITASETFALMRSAFF